MANLFTKQWDEPAGPSDGTRILVCRYRPRGVAKLDETWHEWLAELGPSKSLHAAAYGKTGDAIPWSTYRAAYLKEMLAHKAVIQGLAHRLKEGETLTLLCSSACARESRCHRSLLKSLIEAELNKATDANPT